MKFPPFSQFVTGKTKLAAPHWVGLLQGDGSENRNGAGTAEEAEKQMEARGEEGQAGSSSYLGFLLGAGRQLLAGRSCDVVPTHGLGCFGLLCFGWGRKAHLSV